MIDREVSAEPDGAVAVPSGSDRADFVFLTKDQLSRRYPNVSLAGLTERGGAGLALAGGDIDGFSGGISAMSGTTMS
jgi:hypothetical protein